MKFYIKNGNRYEEYVHVWEELLPEQKWFVEVRSCVQDLNQFVEANEMVVVNETEMNNVAC